MQAYPFVRRSNDDGVGSASGGAAAGTGPASTTANTGGVEVTPDGGLSAPLLVSQTRVVGLFIQPPPDTTSNSQFGSVVIGMVVVHRDDDGGGSLSGASSRASEWDDRAARLLDSVARTLAVAVALDQKQQASAVLQAEQLRRVVSESLHQTKNPLTALRTFGKLLLRRLDQHDTVNRELAKDIIIQRLEARGGTCNIAHAPAHRPPLPPPPKRPPRGLAQPDGSSSGNALVNRHRILFHH